MTSSVRARAVRAALGRLADTDRATSSSRFFRAGKGGYGAGDRFLGVRVPDQRRVARQYHDLPLGEIERLLQDRFHECRLTALLILVAQFEHGDRRGRRKLVDLYLRNLERVNNWDLVDSSAGKILGAWLADRDRGILVRLATSDDLWKQRVAIIATSYFIAHGEFEPTLEIAEILINHEHDLIHKAVGWMLREVGKKDPGLLEAFLGKHYQTMPRTMLRYAIEKFSEERRQDYLRGKVEPRARS